MKVSEFNVHPFLMFIYLFFVYNHVTMSMVSIMMFSCLDLLLSLRLVSGGVSVSVAPESTRFLKNEDASKTLSFVILFI